MSYTYKKLKNIDGTTSTTGVLRKEDNAQIPFDPANRDYQDYLEWAKTNTTDPAD
tara:strand:- start:970 stop:1134 length:165 start_codon:yes stop_codon:yes gene_type:complete